MRCPAPPNNIGKRCTTKHPDGTTSHHKILDEIRIPQVGHKTKLIYLQKIRRSEGREELRLGYYIIGTKPAMRGRWVWGQYATFLPASDLKKIFRLAAKKGWL